MTPDLIQRLQIGSLNLINPLLLAPLSGISDRPFRVLAKESGCALAFTEMISAEGLIRNRRVIEGLAKTCREERPLAVQIFGSRVEAMADAAKMVEDSGADVMDINMGCPVRKVVRGGSGAALLKDLDRIKEMIRLVRGSLTIPFTIKIRSGWDRTMINCLEVARIAEEGGVNGLTLHGRTRAEGYGVKADWEIIGAAKHRVNIPVIGSGDLTTPQAILHFFTQTGCDGAMIGRGALGNPWIFRMSLQMLRGESPSPPSLDEREAMILRHLQMMVELKEETRGVKEFRKHLIWYTRGLEGSVDFRLKIPRWVRSLEVADGVQEYFNILKKASLDR